MTTTTTTAPYDPPVGRWKRPKLPTIDGSGTETYVRGTTLTGTLDDSSALDTWKTRQLVRAARSARLTDDLSAADLLGTDEPTIDPMELRDWLDAVDLGNATIASVPAPYRKLVLAFHTALADAGLTIDPAYTCRWVMHEPTGSVIRVWRVVVAADGVTRAPLVLRTSARTDYGVTADRLAAVLAADSTYRLTADCSAWEPVRRLYRRTAILVHLPAGADASTVTLDQLDLSAARLDLDLALAVRTARSEVKGVLLGKRVRVYADGRVED
ncbi:Uncharacterised protein [Mycobacteroides abscessus]|uniref:hypothetical protein n=1 Tax=Mycobacteroides abscessus TaxID=36809 RepID=UPI0005DB53B7|nr:hypothetical protein [Mycobacteroides abscessus]CPX20660.1 Uncharacterised protein [Mycobacteroides abscessus]CRG61238.1 Uncharacterised protein [Mycobacteroides abscessus]